MDNKLQQKNTGMAVFLAVVFVSILLAVAMSLISISTKGFKISTDSRDSTYAVYAADSGIECALFWDVRGPDILFQPVFATSSDYTANGNQLQPPAGVLDCFGGDILSSSWLVTPIADAATTTFELEFSGASDYCARVLVAKSEYTNPATGLLVPGIYATNVVARGYDTDCSNITPSSVERAIRVSYP